MLTKLLRPAILILIGLAPYGIGQAADMATYCRLKGGSLVQLPAEACAMEGGAPVNVAVSPATPALTAAPAPADINTPVNQPPAGDTSSAAKLTPAQKVVVDLLGKPVADMTPLNKNPEGIDRTAEFDGCRLMVDEVVRIEHGNLFSTLKNFKINSSIDFQKIDRDEFGILGAVASKGGGLKATAVYFEERKRKEGNNISISVLEPRNGSYAKYRSHDPAGYWDAPRDDLWIADEYGYPKDNGWGDAARDTIRILLIVSSSDDAAKLGSALEDVHAMCKSQQVKTK